MPQPQDLDPSDSESDAGGRDASATTRRRKPHADASGDRHTPVDGEGLAGDVAGGGGGEEDGGGGELAGVALAAGGDAGLLELEVALGVLLGHLGLEEAGSDGVDADALAAGPLLREVT